MSDASLTNPPVLAKSDLNLVWLDCEMTGLQPETDRVLEIAVVVTNADLSIRVEGPVFAIHQSDALLDGMDAWNKGTHGRSGLIARVKASEVTEAQAESELLAFLSRYVPKLEGFFHYRNVDVSTLKELARRWKPAVCSAFKKAQRHTALADVHESIDELIHYRQHFLALEPVAPVTA